MRSAGGRRTPPRTERANRTGLSGRRFATTLSVTGLQTATTRFGLRARDRTGAADVSAREGQCPGCDRSRQCLTAASSKQPVARLSPGGHFNGCGEEIVMWREPFSKRFGYAGASQDITVREDAPEPLRVAIVDEAPNCGLDPYDLRRIICRTLRKRPDSNNWSAGNVWGEVQELVDECEWFRVYDIIEAILRELGDDNRLRYTTKLNEVFFEYGIGWKLENTQVVSRGDEAFEFAVRQAAEGFAHAGRITAQREIEEALRDLSRRPTADLTGAIHHGMGALECVARDVCGDDKATLGQVLKRRPDLFPRPLGTALSQLWGFSSDYARHISEERTPTREDAELVVGLAAVVATYLSRKVGL
jgi:hypothetical protein